MGDDDAQRWPTPKWWKQEARQALKDAPRGTRARLAEEMDCNPAAINKMLSAGSRSSSYAMEFSRLLGIRPPVAVLAADLEEWNEIGAELTPEQLRIAIAFVRSMRG